VKARHSGMVGRSLDSSSEQICRLAATPSGSVTQDMKDPEGFHLHIA